MSFFKSMGISSSGLAAQRLRMNVVSANLANAQTTRTDEGGPYKRRDVVFSAIPTGKSFEDFLDGTTNTQLRKVQVTGIHEDTKAPRRVLDPAHPDADADGYVELPIVFVNEARDGDCLKENQCRDLYWRSDILPQFGNILNL